MFVTDAIVLQNYTLVCNIARFSRKNITFASFLERKHNRYRLNEANKTYYLRSAIYLLAIRLLGDIAKYIHVLHGIYIDAYSHRADRVAIGILRFCVHFGKEARQAVLVLILVHVCRRFSNCSALALW